MGAHICCWIDGSIYSASYSVLYVLVSARILESMPADVGRIGAVLTSGNAAAAGPVTGVAGSAAGEVWTGIAVLFCVAAVAFGWLLSRAETRN
jgi:hypothetical protein